MRSALAFTLLVVAAVSLVAVPVVEAVDPIKDALVLGGTRLKNLQNGDGGWFFEVDDPNCGLGPGVSCPNTFGVTALGLLEAFRITRNLQVKAAAVETGDALLSRQDAAPICDGNAATSADRPYTTDVTFLAELTKVTSRGIYKSAGKAWFDCVMADFPTAAERADNRIDGRAAQGLSNLGAWDAANDIRAGVALGLSSYTAYAKAEMKRVIQRRADWDVDDAQCPGCEILSKGGLLRAGAPLKADGTIRTWVNAWRDDLLDAQETDGSWGGGDTQTTAYVVLGLAANPTGPTAAVTAAIKQAITDGVAFLLARQAAAGTGGFEVVAGGGYPENTEVDSEAMQALKAAH